MADGAPPAGAPPPQADESDDEWLLPVDAAAQEAQDWLEDEAESDDEDLVSDGASVSSAEDAAERGAAEAAERETADAVFASRPAAVLIPTTVCHFQSADALAAVEAPDGSLLVAAIEEGDPSQSVGVYRLPTVLESRGGPVAQLRAVATRVGGFQTLTAPYSLAWSADGRVLAVGEDGALTIYTLDLGAPPRPPAPADADLDVDALCSGALFAYTPMLPPDARRVASRVDATELPGARWDEVAPGPPPPNAPGHRPHRLARSTRALSHAFYMRQMFELRAPGDLPLYPPGAALPARHDPAAARAWWNRRASGPAAAGAAPAGDASDSGDESLAEEAQYVVAAFAEHAAARGCNEPAHRQARFRGRDVAQFCRLATVTAAIEREGLVNPPAGCASAPARGALELGAAVALGHADEGAARERAFEPESMVNGCRFGTVAGRERLLAAEQSGWVYVLDLPPPERRAGAALGAALPCTELGATSEHWAMRPVTLFAQAAQTQMGVTLEARGVPARTAALGPFAAGVNLAVASPDGRWIAVCLDAPNLLLLDQRVGFAPRALPLALARPVPPRGAGPRAVDVGAQYCAFTASSTLLAATSDALRAVFVFEPASGARLLRVENFARALLPCAWAPWAEDVLVIAEEARQVHVLRARGGPPDQDAREELAAPRDGSQLLRLPTVPAPAAARLALTEHECVRRRRVTGMCATPGGDLLVAASSGAVWRYPATSVPWSPRAHRRWPASFHAAARALLLSAARLAREAERPGAPPAAATLGSLERDVLEQVLRAAAEPRLDWVADEGAPPPAHMPLDERSEPPQEVRRYLAGL
jgi:hypothetical protein